MMELSETLCQELGLTYWQLKVSDNEKHTELFVISHQERELLRKILLAKGVSLTDEILEIKQDGVVIISLNKCSLIFDNVTLKDTKSVVYLAKLSAMLSNVEEKKLTWYKLKQLDLYS